MTPINCQSHASIIQKWIDSTLACIDTDHANRGTVVHVTRELVFYVDTLLVSTVDDFNNLHNSIGTDWHRPCQSMSTHTDISQIAEGTSTIRNLLVSAWDDCLTLSHISTIRQSSVNPTLIQSDVNKMPIQHQSGGNSFQSNVNLIPIQCQSIQI